MGLFPGLPLRWSPRPIAVVNDCDVRVVEVEGELTRHSHPEIDEFFLVLSGELTIRMDEANVVLSAGGSFVYRNVVGRRQSRVVRSLRRLAAPLGGRSRADRPIAKAAAERMPICAQSTSVRIDVHTHVSSSGSPSS